MSLLMRYNLFYIYQHHQYLLLLLAELLHSGIKSSCTWLNIYRSTRICLSTCISNTHITGYTVPSVLPELC
jgi:hypothetical protein